MPSIFSVYARNLFENFVVSKYCHIFVRDFLIRRLLIYMKNVTYIIICLCFVGIMFGCNQTQTKTSKAVDSGFVFRHEPANAVYHWKSTLAPNSYEMAFLEKHHIKRMYVKFFDVGIDNLYDGAGEQPVPVATTIFNNYPKLIQSKNIEIVPVVFITVEALRLNKPLVDKILERIDAMCRANHIEYKEIQLDCDWTKETKPLFYSICKDAKQKLHYIEKGLSATIRLHQLRYELPDIDYGVLMLYNTESLYNPKVRNSILNSKVVNEYMKHAKSKVHLDFAYPTYEWNLWFKNGKFMGIVPDDTLSDGEIRHEQSDFSEIMKTKHIIKDKLKDIEYPSSIIIYHLDSTNLSKYSDHEIEKIYSR